MAKDPRRGGVSAGAGEPRRAVRPSRRGRTGSGATARDEAERTAGEETESETETGGSEDEGGGGEEGEEDTEAPTSDEGGAGLEPRSILRSILSRRAAGPSILSRRAARGGERRGRRVRWAADVADPAPTERPPMTVVTSVALLPPTLVLPQAGALAGHGGAPARSLVDRVFGGRAGPADGGGGELAVPEPCRNRVAAAWRAGAAASLRATAAGATAADAVALAPTAAGANAFAAAASHLSTPLRAALAANLPLGQRLVVAVEPSLFTALHATPPPIPPAEATRDLDAGRPRRLTLQAASAARGGGGMGGPRELFARYRPGLDALLATFADLRCTVVAWDHVYGGDHRDLDELVDASFGRTASRVRRRLLLGGSGAGRDVRRLFPSQERPPPHPDPPPHAPHGQQQQQRQQQQRQQQQQQQQQQARRLWQAQRQRQRLHEPQLPLAPKPTLGRAPGRPREQPLSLHAMCRHAVLVAPAGAPVAPSSVAHTLFVAAWPPAAARPDEGALFLLAAQLRRLATYPDVPHGLPHAVVAAAADHSRTLAAAVSELGPQANPTGCAVM